MIFAHPTRESFQGSILAALCDRFGRDGHEVRLLDLYGDGFDPVLGVGDWRSHRRNDEGDISEDLKIHVEALQEAQALVLVFPTWWYGMPAMLKGWFDRVWRPGVAFTIRDETFQIHHLANIRRLAVVTTCGSPGTLIEWIVGDPIRRQVMRGLMLQLAKGVPTRWAAIYGVDGKAEAELAAERARAVERVAGLLKG